MVVYVYSRINTEEFMKTQDILSERLEIKISKSDKIKIKHIKQQSVNISSLIRSWIREYYDSL